MILADDRVSLPATDDCAMIGAWALRVAAHAITNGAPHLPPRGMSLATKPLTAPRFPQAPFSILVCADPPVEILMADGSDALPAHPARSLFRAVAVLHERLTHAPELRIDPPSPSPRCGQAFGLSWAVSLLSSVAHGLPTHDAFAPFESGRKLAERRTPMQLLVDALLLFLSTVVVRYN